MGHFNQQEAERRIYFYRAIPANGEQDFRLRRKAICRAIEALKGTSEFYLDQGDDRITCGEVVDDNAPQQIKLYAIRRENLPSRDSGRGIIGDLDLAAEEGLAEAVHVRLYPNNVIAAEFFFYGPRISRLQAFLNQRCGQNLIIEELYRHDVIERALRYHDVRALRFKILPSSESMTDVADELGFDGVVDTAKSFDAGVYADVVLRSEGNDPRFTDKVKRLLRRLRSGGHDPRHLFANLEIQGKDPDSRKVESLNLLSDQLVRTARIPRESVRTRALDSEAAFDAIQTAYDEVRRDLPRDAIRG